MRLLCTFFILCTLTYVCGEEPQSNAAPIIPSAPTDNTPALPSVTPALPSVTPALPPVTPTLPPVTPTLPPVTPALPSVTPALPSVTPALPPVTPALPPVTPALPQPLLPSGNPTTFRVGESRPEGEELYVLVESGFTHITPYGGSRLTFISGELSFDSPFGGRRGTSLDLQDDLFVSEDQWGTYFGIDVQHSFFRINIAYGYNSSSSKGNIPREVIIADSYLQSGSRVAEEIDIHWFSGSFGYTLLANSSFGAGLKLNFGYIYIRSSLDVEGYLADNPTNPKVQISLDNSLFIPVPTIGGYGEIALNDRWVVRGELDFIFYEIVNRKLTTLNFNFETRYYFRATQDFYGFLKFQYEYFNYEFDTKKFRGFYEWHSFLFLIGAGIKF